MSIFLILLSTFVGMGYYLFNRSVKLPGVVTGLVATLCLALGGWGAFTSMFFYAQPGYQYHVRTLDGQEKMVSKTGWAYYGLGWKNAWKKAMTVQATASDSETVSAESDSNNASADLRAERITFLDQVDAHATASVRFRLPTDEASFLALVREYRSPANLLRTSLIPAFQETLQANATLMGAEEYFSGGRTSFNADFEDQIKRGLFVVDRKEVKVADVEFQSRGANASKTEQDTFEENNKVILQVTKRLNSEGVPIRKAQAYTDWGIAAIEARITGVYPNKAFMQRMKQKQEASADRAIAREKRVQEEEQRLLAIARADRQVAERQGEMEVDQIQRTTLAETEKQLALTEASKRLEQADINKQTALILLDKARIDAEAKTVAADAEAYERTVILESDNALQQKLDAEIEIQRVWADAYAKRRVVFAGSGSTDVTQGGDSEVNTFLKLKTVEAAERLNYSRDVAKD